MTTRTRRSIGPRRSHRWCAAGLAVLLGIAFSAVPADAQPAAPAVSTPSSAGTFVPLSPARVLDTGRNLGANGPVAARATISVPIAGQGGVPSSGVAAVALNITAIAPTAAGYLAAYPGGTTRPATSTLNFAARQTVANLADVQLGATGANAGRINVYNASAGTVRIAADVTGYYLAGTAVQPGAFVSLAPARVLDTAASGPVAARSTVTATIGGQGGIPASGVSAVALNITAVGPTATGSLTAYGAGTSRPTSATLPFTAGHNVADLADVGFGGGRISIYNSSAGTVRIVADVAGYYLARTPTQAGAFVPLPSTRVIDTGPVAAKSTVTSTLAGRGGIPATGASAVALTITVQSPAAAGSLTAYATRTTFPSPTLYFAAGQTVANLADLRLGGGISIYNSSTGPVRITADVAGYYRGTASGYAGIRAPLPDDAFRSPGVALDSVACDAPGSCRAVGDYKSGSGGFHTGVVETLAGGVWRPLELSAEGREFSLPSIACGGAGSCAAAGSFYNGRYHAGAVLASLAGGTWTTVLAPVPADADNNAVGSFATLDEVACGAPSACVAVGSYLNDDVGDVGLIETLDNGKWTPQRASADREDGRSPDLTAITCTGPGSCTAVGATFSGVVIETLSGGTWTAQQASLPADAAAVPAVALGSVACDGADTCTAVGYYTDTAGNRDVLIETSSGGAWTAQPVPLPSDAATEPRATLASVACDATDSCTAVGSYANTSDGRAAGLIETYVGGTWSARQAPLPPNADSTRSAGLASITCTGPGRCVTVGSYNDAADNREGVIDTLADGVWTSQQAKLPYDANTRPYAGLDAVACNSGTCTAVGSYDTQQPYTGQGLLETLEPTG